MLHRADASMIWSSYIFDKNNKWLSYNVWFIYLYFYKNIIFCQFYLKENQHYFHNKNITFHQLTHKKKFLSKSKLRFSYYIDLYCIEIYNCIILLNIFFFTTLFFYKQELSKEKIITYNLPFDEYFLPIKTQESIAFYKEFF